MRDRTPTALIDPARCIGCGLCQAVCVDRTLSLEGELAVVSGERCLACGHCQAVCPTGAVRVGAIDDDALDFATFEADHRLLAPGGADPAQLVRLMRSRRSCRNYQDRPVERAVLEDLVRIGTTAPSGTNSQLWTFTILPDRASVLALGQRVGRFFRRLNRLASQAWLRGLLRMVGQGQLAEYHREYYPQVVEALEEWERLGTDRLFHGAPAAILVGSEPGGSCPAEDALLAAGNILLAAHAMGLGACLIGYVVEAIGHDAGIKDFLGIDRAERVHAVIALGYPNEAYQRPAGRRRVAPRYFSAPAKEAK